MMKKKIMVVDDDPSVAAGICNLTKVTAVLFNAFYNQNLKRRKVQRVETWNQVLQIAKKLNEGRE